MGGHLSARRIELPRVANDGAALRENQGEPTVTWIGHATLLVQLAGVNILTDPHGRSAPSPLSFAGPHRVAPPGLRFEDLPPIHVVLISHDHYDHLDEATVRRLAERAPPALLRAARPRTWLADLGITDVVELDWWDSRPERGLTLTCVPVQHWTRALVVRRSNRRLWSGWVMPAAIERLFFGGDTGLLRAGFKEIGARLGPFDLAAISIGAYEPPVIMKFTHTSPEEALQIFADVRARRFFAMHWGTFDLAEEPLGQPPVRLRAEAERLGLDPDTIWVFKPGETRPW